MPHLIGSCAEAAKKGDGRSIVVSASRKRPDAWGRGDPLTPEAKRELLVKAEAILEHGDGELLAAIIELFHRRLIEMN